MVLSLDNWDEEDTCECATECTCIFECDCEDCSCEECVEETVFDDGQQWDY